MPIPYDPNVPQPNNPINETTVPIQNNFAQANADFGTDHDGFNTATSTGFHNKVTIIPQTPAPIQDANRPIIYSLSPSKEIWIQPVSGSTYQLTNGVPSSVAPPGSNITFLPGGFKMAFGYQNTAIPRGTTINTGLTNIISVQTTLIDNTGGGTTQTVYVKSFGGGSFIINTANAGNVLFFWLAVGT